MRVCLRTLNGRTEFYTDMYFLIIEFSFVFTKDLFNNQVAYELRFIELNPNELTGSFVSLYLY
jgi:hypothetical protein